MVLLNGAIIGLQGIDFSRISVVPNLLDSCDMWYKVTSVGYGNLLEGNLWITVKVFPNDWTYLTVQLFYVYPINISYLESMGSVSHIKFHIGVKHAYFKGPPLSSIKQWVILYPKLNLPLGKFHLKSFFKIWFAFSVFPVDCGFREACTFQLIFKFLEKSWYEPRYNFLEKSFSYIGGFLWSARENFNPICEGIQKYKQVSKVTCCIRSCKVNLSIFP